MRCRIRNGLTYHCFHTVPLPVQLCSGIGNTSIANGIGSSGVEAALGGQVVSDAARLEAERFQEWYQQQVENKMGAASMLMQDDWKKMDLEHQEAMARLMFELDRKRELGDDWESGMGDADIRLLMELATSDMLDDNSRNLLNGLLAELYPEYFGSGQPGEWGAPPEGSSPYKTDINGDEWVWVHEEGKWGEGHWEKNVSR